MSHALDRLAASLLLRKVGEGWFVGEPQDPGWGRLFGGFLLGQGLSAACSTVMPTRVSHSLHAYFLRPGEIDLPIHYRVQALDDRENCSVRQVAAYQKDRCILLLTASFTDKALQSHQYDVMPEVPPPRDFMTEDYLPVLGQLPPLEHRAFEVRPVDPEISPTPGPAKRRMWFRARGMPAVSSELLHHSLLAYASDYRFITTCLLPHALEMRIASLDHAMWFHASFRIDDWLLYVIESPAAFGGRGFVRGRVFSREGQLIAHTAQEGYLRRRR